MSFMFARIVEMTSDPNRRDKTNEIFRNSVLPALKQQKGFEGAIQCMNQQGEGVAVSLWESQEEEALSAGEQIYLEQISKFREVFTKPQVRHTGEVRAHDTRAGIAPRAARLTVLPTRPGSETEIVKLYKESVVPAARTQFGFASTYLAQTADGKAIALTLFDSQESLKKSEDVGYYQEQIAKFKPHRTGELSKKIFDVAVHEVLTRAPAAS